MVNLARQFATIYTALIAAVPFMPVSTRPFIRIYCVFRDAASIATAPATKRGRSGKNYSEKEKELGLQEEAEEEGESTSG